MVFTRGFWMLNRAPLINLADKQLLLILYGWHDFIDEGVAHGEEGNCCRPPRSL